MIVGAERIEEVVNCFKGKRIVVLGDLILDHYIFGEVERISPEAPVPVVWANGEKFVGGGAVNVALNLIELGAEVSLCGVVGDDDFAEKLLSIINEKNIDTRLIVKDKKRPTTVKTRIISQHQQMMRLDWESKEFLSLDVNDEVLKKIKKDINGFDGVIVEDYGKGVINPPLVEEIVRVCKRNKMVIAVDPKEEHFDYYENVTVMTPNLKEAQIAAGMKVKSKKEIDILGAIILSKVNLQALLVTLGAEGMRLFLQGGKIYNIPTYALEVYDVTGAGDTVIAVYTLSLVSGASFVEAAVISNFSAGIVVEKLGAATTTKGELLERVKRAKRIEIGG